METILAKVAKKIIVDGAIAQNALPLLPLGGAVAGAAQALAEGAR
jgi:hypothetical protein